MSTFSYYRPTPLERAHATYLLVTYFNTPVDMTNDDGEMRVAGRDAVPFLTSSGVDRSLLRLIWSIADPESVGTLTTRSQFHTILRLIAMAQANFLPPLPTGMEDHHTSLLKEALTNNSHLVMALPTFTRDASPPTVAHLLGTYPTPVFRDVGSSGEGGHRNGSNVDVSNLLINHDFQYQLWQKHQQQQQLSQNHGGDASWGENGGLIATPATKMSVDDAFGDLPEVEDRPLPSLQYSVPEENIETCEAMNVGEGNGHKVGSEVDEFGDFDGVLLQPSIVQKKEPQPRVENHPLDGMNNVESFSGDFDRTHSPFPSPDAMYATVESSPVGAVAGIDASVDIPENEFIDFNASPDNALLSVVGDRPLTDFANLNPSHLSMTCEYGPTLSSLDAFEPLVVKQNAQSTSIDRDDEFGGFESKDMPIDEADQQDGFGGFESTAPHPCVYDNIVVTNEGDEFGAFESKGAEVEGTAIEHNQDGVVFYPESVSYSREPDAFPNPDHLSQLESCSDLHLHQFGTHNATLSITDAFDSLVSDEEVFSIPFDQEFGNDKNAENQGDELVVFGSNDVSSTTESGPHDEIVKAFQDTAQNTGHFIESTSTSDNVHNSMQQLGSDVPTVAISDAFASFIGDQESAASSEGKLAFAQTSVHTTEENHGIPSDPAHSEGSADGNKATILEEKKTSDDDNIKPESEQIFIDSSEVAVSNQGNTEIGIQSVGLAAFDDIFGGIEDAPLPPLEAFSTTLEETEKFNAFEISEFDESFGDFEANAVEAGFIPEGESFQNTLFADAGLGTVASLPQTLIIEDVAHQTSVDGVTSDPHILLQPVETCPQEAEKRDLSQMVDAQEVNDSFGDFEGTSAIAGRYEKPSHRPETFAELSLTRGDTASNVGNVDHQIANEANKAMTYSLSVEAALSPVDLDKATNDKLDHEKHYDFHGFSTYDNVAYSQDNDMPAQQTSIGNDHTYGNNDISGFSPFDPALDTEGVAHAEDVGTLNHYELAQFEGKKQPTDGSQACSGTQSEATTELSEANDDDFGDFSAFGPSDKMQVKDRPDHNGQNHCPADFRGNNIVRTEANDDDYVNFASVGSPDVAHTESRSDDAQKCHPTVSNHQPEAALDRHDVDLEHAGVNCDDFGAFLAFGSVDHAEDMTRGTQGNHVTNLRKHSEASEDLHVNNIVHTEDDDEDDFDDFSAFGSPDTLHTERVNTQENNSIMLIRKSEATVDLDVNNVVSMEGDHDGFGDFSAFSSAEMLHTEDGVRDQKDLSSVSNKQSEAAAGLEVNDFVSTEGDFCEFSAFGSTLLHTEVTVHTLEDRSTISKKQSEAAADRLGDDINVEADDNEFAGFAAFDSRDHTQDDHASTSNEKSGTPVDLHVNNFIHNGVDDHDLDAFAAFESADAAHTEVVNGHTSRDQPSSSNNQLWAAADLHDDNIYGTVGNDDEFGNFNACEATASTAIANASDDTSFDAEFGEFAQFDSARSKDATSHVVFHDSSLSCDDLSEKIHAIKQLPSSYPPKEIIVQYFEKCMKKRETPRSLLSRCVTVCELLSDVNSDLSQQWENVISSVKIDLERGEKILDIFSGCLTPADRSIILQSEKLRVYILGLGEFVRISRSIMASIRDILCLDINSEVLESSSDWTKGKFFTNTLCIEEAWGNICSKALDLGLLSETPQLESIDEIRSHYLNLASGEQDDLCQLTLQPLNNDGNNQGTKSTVKWDGKQYMSCAANFLANRLPQLAYV